MTCICFWIIPAFQFVNPLLIFPICFTFIVFNISSQNIIIFMEWTQFFTKSTQYTFTYFLVDIYSFKFSWVWSINCILWIIVMYAESLCWYRCRDVKNRKMFGCDELMMFSKVCCLWVPMKQAWISKYFYQCIRFFS